MTEKFIVRPKSTDKKPDKYVLTTLRLEKDLLEEFEKLSGKSGHSRNALMCMALQYALDHLEFVSCDNTEK